MEKRELELFKLMLGAATAIALTVFTLVGCGGSGGGGGLSYQGNKAAAFISSTSAQEIAMGAFETSGDSASLIELSPIGVAVIADSGETEPSPLLLELGNILMHQFSFDELISMAEGLSVGASAYISEPGSCGGHITISVTANSEIPEEITHMTASVTYSNYCAIDTGGATFNGGMSLAISENPDTLGIDATFNFSNLTFSESGSDDVTIHGSLVLADPLEGPTTMTTNLVMRNNSTDIYLKIEDYVITIDNVLNEATISGRLYHSEYGYVDIITLDPFDISGGDPVTGSIEITGAENSKIRLTLDTPAGTTYYTIDLDLDGSGDYGDFTTCVDGLGDPCPPI